MENKCVPRLKNYERMDGRFIHVKSFLVRTEPLFIGIESPTLDKINDLLLGTPTVEKDFTRP